MAGTDQQLARLAEVQRRYNDFLLKKKHVISTSIRPSGENGKVTGDFALVILVDRKVHRDDLAPEDQIPALLDNVPVIVHEANLVEAF